jgi:hypothetical protein
VVGYLYRLRCEKFLSICLYKKNLCWVCDVIGVGCWSARENQVCGRVWSGCADGLRGFGESWRSERAEIRGLEWLGDGFPFCGYGFGFGFAFSGSDFRFWDRFRGFGFCFWDFRSPEGFESAKADPKRIPKGPKSEKMPKEVSRVGFNCV